MTPTPRRAAWPSPLAGVLAEAAAERFLRYVRFDTQSQPGIDSSPSTPGQRELALALAAELRSLGLAAAAVDEHGYLLATLPGTIDAPAIGLIAHLDTSAAESGTDVKPLLHRAYTGRPLRLPGDRRQVLDPAELPQLAEHVGHDRITSDGTTLLGADDKAGIAAIVTALDYLLAHPEIGHGPISIAFVPDEEVGAGAKHLDLDRFAAPAAYTVDGLGAGQIETETFSAADVFIHIEGRAVNSGYGAGKLVSSVKLAARLIEQLPPELAPETAGPCDGFIHPASIEGRTAATTLHLLVRDFDDHRLDEAITLLRRLAGELAAAEPRAELAVKVEPATAT